MNSQDREKLLQLAKMFNVTGKRSVQVPTEVLQGVSRTLANIATGESKRTFTREAVRQMWTDSSSRYMARHCQQHRLAG